MGTAEIHTSKRPTANSRADNRIKLRDAEATREAILLAATEEFAEKGLHGARVEEIAARTATSKHMIYYYFGSKDGLYGAVLERVYADFRTAEGRAQLNLDDPVAALANLVGLTFDSHVDHPERIRILMSENLDLGRRASELDHTLQRELVVETLGRIIGRGQKTGAFCAGLDLVQLHMSISSLCFYYVSNAHTFSKIFDFDMTDPANRELRRAEVIETILCRCRA
jgi:TetR/AcrR family transcriptional regulator